MKCTFTLLIALLFLPLTAFAADKPPQTVGALWSHFDLRKDPLEVEVVRQWKEVGGVYHNVRYLIGNFKGRPARMAAFDGFPEDAKRKLPAVMHMRGGGQLRRAGNIGRSDGTMGSNTVCIHAFSYSGQVVHAKLAGDTQLRIFVKKTSETSNLWKLIGGAFSWVSFL